MNPSGLTQSPRDDLVAWLRLALQPGVSPRVQSQLLAAFGNASGVLAAPQRAVADIAGIEVAEALAKGPDPRLLEATLRWGEAPANHLLTRADDSYPRLLREITDAPAVLYATGRIDLLNVPTVAIVGSRNATPQGRRDALEFATLLSRQGLCIASGLALGIDAAAHRGGLDGRGSSVAVTGTGADIVYPPRNRELASEIAQRGCVVTEFPLGIGPIAGNFPRRNRLISGLSRGVIVVEAAQRSGSLITAYFAANQDREVFAIPGSIHSTLSKGCHRLIKEGAKLVETADDVLAELGMAMQPVEPMAPASDADPLLDELGFAPFSLDQIAQRTGAQVGALSAQLSLLEIAGRVEALPGGWFQRVRASS